MVHITSLEGGLRRLLKLCPKLTLDPRAIQLIIDGKQNQVIFEHKNPQKNKPVEHKCNTSGCKSEDEHEKITIDERKIKEITVDSDKSFDEYFKD